MGIGTGRKPDKTAGRFTFPTPGFNPPRNPDADMDLDIELP